MWRLVLVASHDSERPIIGFNVIEELALTNDTHDDCIPSGHMVKRLCSVLEVGHKIARAVLYVLKKQTPLRQSKQTTSDHPEEQSGGIKDLEMDIQLTNISIKK